MENLKIKKALSPQKTPPSNTKTSMLLQLPLFPFTIILDFLSPEAIYSSLALTCKGIHKVIESFPFIKTNCQIKCLGISTEIQLPSNFNGENLLKSLSNSQVLKEIPFYGHFTDGGIDQNNTEYWVNRVFTKGNWSICSRSGKNFHLIGNLVKGKESIGENKLIYAEIFKFCRDLYTRQSWSDRLFHCFKRRPSELQEYFNERVFRFTLALQQERIQQYLIKKQSKICRNDILKSYTVDEIMDSVESFVRNSEIPLEKIEFISDYILKEKNIMIDNGNLAIIRSVQFSRTGYFTCPVKTFMIFLADEVIDYHKDQEFHSFDECIDINTLVKRLSEMKLNNTIKCTNISQLEKMSDKLKPNSQDFEYILFKNNIKNQNLGKYKPMLWVKIINPDLNKIHLNFPQNNCFSGKTVMLKLMECDEKPGYDDDLSNIDINYCSFLGEVIEL